MRPHSHCLAIRATNLHFPVPCLNCRSDIHEAFELAMGDSEEGGSKMVLFSTADKLIVQGDLGALMMAGMAERIGEASSQAP